MVTRTLCTSRKVSYDTYFSYLQTKQYKKFLGFTLSQSRFNLSLSLSLSIYLSFSLSLSLTRLTYLGRYPFYWGLVGNWRKRFFFLEKSESGKKESDRQRKKEAKNTTSGAPTFALTTSCRWRCSQQNEIMSQRRKKLCIDS